MAQSGGRSCCNEPITDPRNQAHTNLPVLNGFASRPPQSESPQVIKQPTIKAGDEQLDGANWQSSTRKSHIGKPACQISNSYAGVPALTTGPAKLVSRVGRKFREKPGTAIPTQAANRDSLTSCLQSDLCYNERSQFMAGTILPLVVALITPCAPISS
jgi:hypothetical protein